MSRLNFVGIRPPAPPRPFYRSPAELLRDPATVRLLAAVQTGALRASLPDELCHDAECRCDACLVVTDSLELEFRALERAVRQRGCLHGPWRHVGRVGQRPTLMICERCGKELD